MLNEQPEAIRYMDRGQELEDNEWHGHPECEPETNPDQSFDLLNEFD